MPIVNRVADLHNEIMEWRRDFHAYPELRYDVYRTAGSVAEKLKSFGCDEVVPGIGRIDYFDLTLLSVRNLSNIAHIRACIALNQCSELVENVLIYSRRLDRC